MSSYNYTCSPDADPGLSGVPAKIGRYENGEFILEFEEGSALAVSPAQLLDLEETELKEPIDEPRL